MQPRILPHSITFRQANHSDARGIAQVHVDSWRTTYAGIVPDEFLRNLSYERREKQWQNFYSNPEPRSHIWLALDRDTVVGFSSGGPKRDGDHDDGEVYAIYLLNRYQGHGIGKELFQRSFASMCTDGFTSVTLWALADNPACSFYRQMGGHLVSEKMENIGGALLKELSFRWSKLGTGT